MNKRKVIKSKLRFTVFMIIVMILSVTSINTVLGLNKAAGTTEKKYIQIEVSAGDTLWNIAGLYAGENTDIRDAVHQICKINGIKADDLTEGLILNIPEEF